MPPHREGLKKRTTSSSLVDKSEDSDKDVSPQLVTKFSESDDLLKVFDDQDNDSTDSEGEVEESDGELDEPVFNSDDEEDDGLSANSSSPGEDSEDDLGTDNSEEDDDEDEDDDEESGFDQTSSVDFSDDENVKYKLNDVDLSAPEKSQDNKKNGNKNNDLKSNISKKKANKIVQISNDKNVGSINSEEFDEKRSDSKKDSLNIVKNKSKRNKKNKNNQETLPQIQNIAINNEEDVKDEYRSGDSSDEEDRRNTVGNIPLEWYKEYPHIGYNLDGKQILKPPQRDQIEDFLKRCEDPDFWRTVRDPTTGQDVILSKADLEVIARLRQGKTPDASYNDYPEWVEWFSSEVLQTPVRAFPEHKRSFLPSALEQRQVNKLVKALRAGWIKTRKQDRIDREKKKEKQFYMIWSSDDRAEEMRRIRNHIAPPKRALPGHAESYNPPPEYLLDAREMKQWKKMEKTPWKRKYTFLPQKFGSLREVPAYTRYTRERFLRCLDLYLAPRAIKMRLTIDPEQLVPKLPNPQDLQPFPTHESMVYRGHTDMVRCIDLDPTGQYLFSGCEDGSVKVWEVSTGRCLKTMQFNGCIKCVQSAPGAALSLLAIACGKRLLLVSPGRSIGDHKVAEKTDELLAEAPDNSDTIVDNRISTAVQWDKVTPEEWELGVRISVTHFKEIKQVHWHGRGDYICVVLPEGLNRSVIVHQISRRRSQIPFSKAKGLVQCALFHPVRPYLFVATQRVVRIYDLVKQELVKKLLTAAQWISTMAIHPAGDNLLVATYDKKMMWFDLDLSSKPYQTLRLHGAAVRGVAFHKRYPLFASGSDDRKLIVSHGMVYNDLLQNPLIVPLKQLQTHEPHDDFGILDVVFHPMQPWVFSAGADSTIRLYT